MGTRSVSCEFVVEIAGSGTAGTAPAWGLLLRACGFAEVVTAGTRVDYTPITNDQESLTLYWFDSGVRHVLRGARGNVTIALNSGERPELRFQFQGLYSNPTATTVSGTVFSAFVTPLVVTDANSPGIKLGSTVAATGAPAVSGGTSYASLGLEIAMNNSVQFTPLLGGESVDITARAVDSTLRLDLTPAQEVSLMSSVLAATLQPLTFEHGTTAGNKVIVAKPSTQLYEPSKEELNGRRLIGFRGRGVPTPGGSGNDEIRVVVY